MKINNYINKNTRWTDKDIKWLKKNFKIKTMGEKSEYLKRSKTAILFKQQTLGLIRCSQVLKIGDTINYWTLINKIIKNKAVHYECACRCGIVKIIARNSLIRQASKSCGCFAIEKKTKHGLSYSKNYKAWLAIKGRCYNKSYNEYKNYGARGITISSEWVNNPKAFCDYLDNTLGQRPNNHSLDRINNNGNYEPGNLRWADQKTQIRNSRTAKLTANEVIEIKQLLKNNVKITNLCKKYNVSHGAIYGIRNGSNWKDVK